MTIHLSPRDMGTAEQLREWTSGSQFGFRVWGFRVSRLGFRLGFRVQGFKGFVLYGFRVGV